MSKENRNTEKAQSIERTDVGVSVKVTMTNGTGTRDQARVEAKFKGPTLEDVIEDYDEGKEDALFDVMREVREEQREINKAE